MAGGEFVGFNNSVFLAEKEVSDRNYALSYYMKENNCFPKGVNIKDCLDFWYQVSCIRKEVFFLCQIRIQVWLFISRIQVCVRLQPRRICLAVLRDGGEL